MYSCLYIAMSSGKLKEHSRLLLLSIIRPGLGFCALLTQQKYFRFDNAEDGLPISTIPYEPSQDKDGFIWVASFRAISIYDGYEFNNYTENRGLLYKKSQPYNSYHQTEAVLVDSS